MAEKGDEGCLATVLGSDNEDAVERRESAQSDHETLDGYNAYLNGVGSFLRRILRGLFMLIGAIDEA